MLSFILAVTLVFQSASPQASPKATPPAPAAKTAPTPAAPAGEIHGVVLLPDGRPAARARVGFTATPALGQPMPAPTVITADETGAFRFEAGGVKEFALRAWLAPFAAASQPRVSAGTRLTLKLEPGIAVSGEVLDAASGSPLAGASLRAADWDVSPFDEADPDFSVARTTSDARGRFTLQGVSAGGRPIIRATARGFASETATLSGSQPVRFRLMPGHDLRGTVTDRAGRPVPKAALSLRSPSSNLTARSAANGRFDVPGLKEQPYDAVVIAEGFAPLIRNGLGPEVSTWPVILDKASSVTGRMVDEDGKPLKGVVRLKSHEGTPTPAAFGRLATSQVGADGLFRISALRPGSNVILLAGAGYPAFEKVIEVDHAGEAVALGDVAFDGGATIRGRVVERDDVGVPAARIAAIPSRRVDGADPLFAEADAEGRFVMRGLKDQAYDLQVMAAGFAQFHTSLSPSADEQIVVLKRALKVTGRVVDPEGVPVARVQVSVQRGDDRRSFRNATSAADGRFTLELGEAGETTLTAAVESFERLTRKVQVDGDADIGDLALSRGLRLRGVVVDGKGSAIAGARVENQSTRQFPMTFAETDDKGAFEIRGVSPGRARLVASHRDYSPGQISVDAPEGAAGDPEPVRITLTRGGRIEGVVRQRDGSPVAQARVELWRFGSSQAPRPSNAPQDSTVTGPDGSFVFEKLYPGLARTALMSGQNGQFTSVAGAEVQIVEGETAQVSLVLRPTVVRGTVRRGGQDLPGVKVSIRGEFMTMSGGAQASPSLGSAIPWSSATTDAQGRFALQVAGPIKGPLTVDRGGTERLYSRMVDIPDVDEFALDIELGAARLTGRVVDAETGLGIAGARVGASRVVKPGSSSPAPSYGVTTEASGEFTFDAEPGDYRISISASNYAGAVRNAAISPPETPLGDISLSHGGTFLGRAVLASGRPVPDAQVRASSPGGLVTAMSGADGAFTLRGLSPGPFFVTATDSSDNIAVLKVESLTADAVDVRLVPAARLAVSVLGPPAPLSGILVAVTQVDGDRYAGSFGVTTDARGQTLLLAPAGTLTLTASSARYTGTAVVQARSGESIAATIEMKPNPQTPPGRD
ncbi:MAG: carboxypeptidase-like regulatory domain-containing protein [Vicinamibacteria bacterium]|nr:carboxypeptidase-like regulatory domain-containing protein [Vicinamibacteria bacterium]